MRPSKPPLDAASDEADSKFVGTCPAPPGLPGRVRGSRSRLTRFETEDGCEAVFRPTAPSPSVTRRDVGAAQEDGVARDDDDADTFPCVPLLSRDRHLASVSGLILPRFTTSLFKAAM